MELFASDDVNIDDGLNALQRAGFIIRYEIDRGRYIHVLNFSKHQNPHVKESPSKIPKPNASSVQASDKPGANTSTAPPDSLNPDSLNPDSLNPDSLNPDCGFSESLQH